MDNKLAKMLIAGVFMIASGVFNLSDNEFSSMKIICYIISAIFILSSYFWND